MLSRSFGFHGQGWRQAGGCLRGVVNKIRWLYRKVDHSKLNDVEVDRIRLNKMEKIICEKKKQWGGEKKKVGKVGNFRHILVRLLLLRQIHPHLRQ